MSEWTTEELSKIETAEELKIASMGRDGTLRKPVTIWVVRHGDQIYVRSVGGPQRRVVSWHPDAPSGPYSSRRCGEGRELRVRRPR